MNPTIKIGVSQATVNDNGILVPTVLGTVTNVSLTLSISAHHSISFTCEAEEWCEAVSGFQSDTDVFIAARATRSGMQAYYGTDVYLFVAQKVDYGQTLVTVSGIDVFWQYDTLEPMKKQESVYFSFGNAPDYNHIRFSLLKNSPVDTALGHAISGYTDGQEKMHAWAKTPTTQSSGLSLMPEKSTHDYESVPLYPKLWNVANGLGYGIIPMTMKSAFGSADEFYYKPQLTIVRGMKSTYPIEPFTATKVTTATVDNSTHVDLVTVVVPNLATLWEGSYGDASGQHRGTIVENCPDDIQKQGSDAIIAWARGKGTDYLYDHRTLRTYNVNVPSDAYNGIPIYYDDGKTSPYIYLGSWVDVRTTVDEVTAQVAESTEVWKNGGYTCKLTVGTVRPSNVALYNMR